MKLRKIRFSDETWIDIIIPYILLPLYLIIVLIGFSCSKAFGQPLTQTQLIQKIATAKVGDVLSRAGNVEKRKASLDGKITAKIYGSPQWDANGQPLLKHSDLTGKITSRGRYVKYVPDANTAKLTVKREKGNASIKEYWTVPDASVTKLVWTVDTDAWYVGFGDETLIFYDSLNKELFRSPPPIAWDADKKEVRIKVSYIDKQLIYDIILDKYVYPITVDPSIIFVDIDALSGLIQTTAHITYVSSRDSISADIVNNTNQQVGQLLLTTYYNYRILHRYDTSTMPTYTTIDSAKVRVVISADNSTTDFNMRICDTTDSLAAAYFNTTMYDEIKGWAASGAYTPTYLSDDVIGSSGKSVGDTLTFKFNANGITNLNLTGTTQFFILSANDIASTEPINSERISFTDGAEYIQLWYSVASAVQKRSILSKDGVITPLMLDGVITPLRSP